MASLSQDGGSDRLFQHAFARRFHWRVTGAQDYRDMNLMRVRDGKIVEALGSTSSWMRSVTRLRFS